MFTPGGPSARAIVKHIPGVVGTEQVKVVRIQNARVGVGPGLNPHAPAAGTSSLLLTSVRWRSRLAECGGKAGRAPGLLGVDPSQEIAQPEKPTYDLKTKDYCLITFWNSSSAGPGSDSRVHTWGTDSNLTPQENEAFHPWGACGCCLAKGHGRAALQVC